MGGLERYLGESRRQDVLGSLVEGEEGQKKGGVVEE